MQNAEPEIRATVAVNPLPRGFPAPHSAFRNASRSSGGSSTGDEKVLRPAPSSCRPHRRFSHFAPQPSLGHAQIAAYRSRSDAQRGANLLNLEASEIAQVDDAALAVIGLLKRFDRVVKSDNGRWSLGGNIPRMVQVDEKIPIPLP